MRIDANDFELFGLPLRYALSRAEIDTRWKALQAQVHPDRFAAEGPAAQQIAMQWAVRVNEAHVRLKSPLARAAYLCELHGERPCEEGQTAGSADFLLQQVLWRESLEEARDPEGLERLASEVAAVRQSLYDALARAIDDRREWAVAADHVRSLMFVERFSRDIESRLDDSTA